ncbi:MarR family transcriptional regulator [Streptomyces sp. P9(2023)]|uniref:MarR family transcriptional regulator n=1 Tax=Streptomyces sp. P9(2023) TaxID=3064394 RepID=UPI0028F4567C|nr:MarR family transcriptional regulator [Streptomyces sp. P9(2023)]MDT9688214.1 MarR family transcriptional regulator [Streptomyces sp. P9(2023)]
MSTATTPSVNGQVVGLAHYATKAVMERAIAPLGLTHLQSLSLNFVAAQGGSAARGSIAGRLRENLKIEEAAALAPVTELLAAGLLEAADGSDVRLTDRGRALQEQASGYGAAIAARVYAGFTPEELATAGRVLSIVTARANAELAGEQP